MKTYQIYRAIDDFIAARNLAPESREDFFIELQDALPNAEDAEQERKLLEDALDKRPHLLSPENVNIPDEELEPCFGDEPSLAARGALIKKYGRGAYDRFRDLWKASDANLNPGQNPNGAAQRKSGADKKGEEPDVAPSKNPWHPAFRGDKNAAIEAIIKTMGSKGATRMARAAKTPDAPLGRTLSGHPLRK
jgi:hypothetical protein